MAKIKCSKCKADGECTCRAVGDGTIAIKFTFYCGTCGFLDKESINVNDENEATCPFCGQSSREHKETPQFIFGA